MTKKRILLPLLVFLLAFIGTSFANKYPGIGVVSCGDHWSTLTPSGFGNIINVNPPTSWSGYIGRITGISFFTPGGMYPAGEEMHMYWGGSLYMYEASTQPINFIQTGISDDLKHYMRVYNHNNLAGTAKTSNGGDIGRAPWSSAARTMQVYEAIIPTNSGIDCKFRVHGFSNNHANLNNQIMFELQMTNTGNADYNADGVVDFPNHRIDAVTLEIQNGAYGGVFSATSSGGRSYAGGWANSRLCGYDATPDAEGNPWAVPVNYHTNIQPGSVSEDPATGGNTWFDGERSIGFRKNYMIPWDIFDGNQFIAVKSGRIDDGSGAPDKKTIFDTHGIGEGVERGWYASWSRGVPSMGGARESFLQSMGTFMEDGGRTQSAASFVASQPDPNVFDTSDPTKYDPLNPLTWVNIVKPEGSRGRPNGSPKYRNKWLQNWERNFPQTPDPKIPALDEWTQGGTTVDYYNFDTEALVAAGPFSLEVGETITMVWTQYAGHRLQGARQAVKTARDVYAKNFVIPEPPSMPDMKIGPTQTPAGEFKNRIIWDARAEAAADFAGYKIYRVTAYPQVDYSVLGIRFMDGQHLQGPEAIGMADDQLAANYAAPNNPNYNVAASRIMKRSGSPAGPWKLQAYITKDQLVNYANTNTADNAAYKYEWIDTSEEVKIGYTYYYYVAAFDNESGELGGVPFTHLESGKDNWNGRNGEWLGTYHFAPGNSDYPTYSLVNQKNLGVPFVLQPARVDRQKLISGEMKIGVKPNPYKVQAPHDVGLEHKVQFYNLTADTRITILDLSGQIIEVLEYEGTNPTQGSVFWDMFTKDGPEVASGLYIWVAEYQGGSQQGYVAIQR